MLLAGERNRTVSAGPVHAQEAFEGPRYRRTDACGVTFVEQGITGLCSLQLQVQHVLHVRMIEVSQLLFSLPGS